jgi:fused signal recognition particle receptor
MESPRWYLWSSIKKWVKGASNLSLVARFKAGLARSKEGFLRGIDLLFRGGELDDEFYEALEESLILGDVGVETTLKLIERLRLETKRRKVTERSRAREILIEEIAAMLSGPAEQPRPAEKPLVILLIGVNGSGKTTTAAKLAHRYRSVGDRVLLVAGDTFRAAAIEQLQIWAKRADADLISQQPGSDPSAVFYDALNAARARQTDVVIGDTAGRLHTRVNLMEELKKINRVIGRLQPGAPHRVLLVIDATTGHNGIAQAAHFNEAVPVDGLILTKLDGTARGGIVVAIQDLLKVPVCYVGMGEQLEDLLPFDALDFAKALLA